MIFVVLTATDILSQLLQGLSTCNIFFQVSYRDHHLILFSLCFFIYEMPTPTIVLDGDNSRVLDLSNGTLQCLSSST